MPGAVQNSLGTLMVLRIMVLDEAGVKQVVLWERRKRQMGRRDG